MRFKLINNIKKEQLMKIQSRNPNRINFKGDKPSWPVGKVKDAIKVTEEVCAGTSSQTSFFRHMDDGVRVVEKAVKPSGGFIGEIFHTVGETINAIF